MLRTVVKLVLHLFPSGEIGNHDDAANVGSIARAWNVRQEYGHRLAVGFDQVGVVLGPDARASIRSARLDGRPIFVDNQVHDLSSEKGVGRDLEQVAQAGVHVLQPGLTRLSEGVGSYSRGRQARNLLSSAAPVRMELLCLCSC